MPIGLNTKTGIGWHEAIQKLEAKTPVAVALSSKQWADMPVAVREHSFWAAGVANAKWLARAQRLLLDYLKQTTITVPGKGRTLKVGGRSEFVRQMIDFAKREGIPLQGPKGTITDIQSSTRLRLLFDTNIRLAEGYAYWREGQSPEILRAYPALRFIRAEERKVPRPVHEANIGQIRRKDDIAFWLAMNSPVFGGFGLPHGPWGFNSGCDTEDVDRATAIDEGVIDIDSEIVPPAVKFAEVMRTSMRGINPQIKARLAKEFGEVLVFKGDVAIFRKPGIIEQASQELGPQRPQKLLDTPGNAITSPTSLEKPAPATAKPKKPKIEGSETIKPKAFPDTFSALSFIKELGGDTRAKLFRDRSTGRQFVVKLSGGIQQAQEEQNASAAYRAAGVAVPESKLLTTPQGRLVFVSAFVIGETLGAWWKHARPAERKEMAASIANDFVVDALLANVDVIGSKGDNIVVAADGTPWRVDVGASLRFGASGSPKGNAFERTVPELDSLRNPAVSPFQSSIFATITEEQLKKQIQEVLLLKAAILAFLPEELHSVMKARFEYLKKVAATERKSDG